MKLSEVQHVKDFLRGLPYVFVAAVAVCILVYFIASAMAMFGEWWVLGFLLLVCLTGISQLVGAAIRIKEAERQVPREH